ncbi:MAG: translocation/assembly module TamB domain-containing protein, partial [Sphingomonas bacterium]
RLDIKGFTRSGAATVSTPVDIAAQGQIRATGDNLDAVIRRGGAVIGRAQVRLQPRGSTALSALSNAPMSGGIRYNGPADVLSSLSGIAGQTVSGPIGIAADFSGTPAAPQVNGVIRANALAYDNQTYGTRLSALRVTGRFTNDRLEISELSGRAGSGTVTARGSIGFGANAGYPIDIRATFAKAQLARSDALGATVSGDVAITNSAANGALISGTLVLPEVRYEVIRQGAAEVAELQGVRRKGTSRAQAAREAAAEGPPGLFKLNLRIRADKRLYVSGMGLESEWSADLRVRGTSAAPIVAGNVDLVRGTYSFAGRRFDLDQNSVIRFEGGAPSNPVLSLTATGSVSGTAITINISGHAQNPQISFTSSPSLPQDELLSRILFGNSVTSLSPIQALQLAAALNSLRGSGGGLNPLGKLRSASGISRLRILGADEATGRGTAVAAGKYISNNIYVEIVTDTKGFTATQLEIALSKALSILSQTGGANGTAINLRYSKDY